MTILVTGATGFAGINIVKALAESGQSVVALDAVRASPECNRYIEAFKSEITFCIGNVLDYQATLELAKEHGVRRIVHAAAITPSGAVESSMPGHVINVNLMGTVNMLEVARQIAAERFVFVSSSGVYGAPESRDQRVIEESQKTPENLYSICKVAGELLVRRYKDLFGMSTVAGRMAAIYGPMERVTSSRGNPSIIYKLIRAHHRGSVVTARGGEVVSDYTHVEDASWIWRNLALANYLKHDIYNVSAGVAYSLNDVLQTLHQIDPTFIFRYVGPGESVDVEIRPESERGALDLTRLSDDLDFRPRYNLEQGLGSYLNWVREYPTMFPPPPG